MAGAQARLHVRQPARGRGRHRRRARGHRVGRRAPRALLGTARRRGQLRHRHRVPPPAAPRRARSSTAACWCSRRRWPATSCASGATSCSTRPTRWAAALAFITAPPLEFVPEPVRGHPIVACIACYAGDVAEDGERDAPLREFGPPGLDLFGEIPYVAVQDLIDRGQPAAASQLLVGRLPTTSCPTTPSTCSSAIATQPVSPFTSILLAAGGGAVVTRARGRHRVRGAARAVQHALPLDVGDPADDERNIDLHACARGGDEAVGDRPRRT